MIRVHFNSTETANPAFVGEPDQAAAFLRELGAGNPVTIRHDGGLRSCMNKPALWHWLESRGKPILGYAASFLNPRHGNPFKVNAVQAGLVGDYFDGVPFKPDQSELESLVPYRYRKAIQRGGLQFWHQASIGHNDGAWDIKLYSLRGRYMTKIRFEAIREGMES